MMTFCMNAISRSLKDHVPSNLSFIANSPDDTMIENVVGASTGGAASSMMNPEISTAIFSVPELEQTIF